MESGLLLSWLLAQACHRADRERVRELLRMGADPERLISPMESRCLPRPSPPIPGYFLEERSALMIASYSKSAGIVEDLIQAGADPNQEDAKGRPALHYAASGGDCEVIALLLDAGARINAVDKLGDGALASAVYDQRARLEAMELLLARGAEQRGISPQAEQAARLSWDPTGESKWSLDERARAMLLADREGRELARSARKPAAGSEGRSGKAPRI